MIAGPAAGTGGPVEPDDDEAEDDDDARGDEDGIVSGERAPVLPAYARVVRGLRGGSHPFLALLPRAAESPATTRIGTPDIPVGQLLAETVVDIEPGDGYVYVDVGQPAIVLREGYYRHGADLDLYLDLLHELTHMRQLAQGFDLWDERFAYVDRFTEIEGYAVAVEEGRRLGMSDADVMRHLSNPWMTDGDVRRLADHIVRFLGRS